MHMMHIARNRILHPQQLNHVIVGLDFQQVMILVRDPPQNRIQQVPFLRIPKRSHIPAPIQQTASAL